jgi:hypothetical protein
MKPNKWMLLGILVVVVVVAVKVYAGSLTMTTYYPAPTGYYDAMRVNNTLVLPCYRTAPTSPVGGQIWVVDTSCQ